MKETGIVRQIDELGRIVLPEEIRRNLRIREGDHLEIYTHEASIVIKKYSPVESATDFAEKLADALYSSTKKTVIITDKEKVIAAFGLSQNIVGKEISVKLNEIIHAGNSLVEEKEFAVTNSFSTKKPTLIKPISDYGTIIGSIIISGDKISEVDKALSTYVNGLFVKHLG